MNRYINENLKPGEQTSSSHSHKINQISLNQWIQTEPNTNAMQLIRHILTNDTRRNNKKVFFKSFSFLMKHLRLNFLIVYDLVKSVGIKNYFDLKHKINFHWKLVC